MLAVSSPAASSACCHANGAWQTPGHAPFLSTPVSTAGLHGWLSVVQWNFIRSLFKRNFKTSTNSTEPGPTQSQNRVWSWVRVLIRVRLHIHTSANKPDLLDKQIGVGLKRTDPYSSSSPFLSTVTLIWHNHLLWDLNYELHPSRWMSFALLLRSCLHLSEGRHDLHLRPHLSNQRGAERRSLWVQQEPRWEWEGWFIPEAGWRSVSCQVSAAAASLRLHAAATARQHKTEHTRTQMVRGFHRENTLMPCTHLRIKQEEKGGIQLPLWIITVATGEEEPPPGRRNVKHRKTSVRFLSPSHDFFNF